MSGVLAERIALVLVLVLLVTAPLFLGSVPGFDTTDPEPGPWLAFFQALGPWHLFLGLGITLAVFVVIVGVRPDRDARWPLVLLGGLAVLAALQCVPLPRFLGAILAPAATEHREALGLDGWAAISWDVGATGREIGRIVAHLAIVAAVALLVRTRSARWLLAGSVVFVAGLDALYGLAEHFLLDDQILGFDKLTGTGKVTGTFINKNHLAAMMEIAIPLAGAMLFYRHRRGRAEGETPGLADALLVIALLAMVAAAILTLSRAAYVATFAGVLVLLFLAVFGRAGKVGMVKTAIFIVLVAAVALVILQTFEPLATRFGHGVSDKGFFDIRFPAWESTLEMAADQPVLGTGMGTFAGAIHAYQSPLVPDELIHAHNDYLNLFSDGGIVGLAIGALLVFLVVRVAWKRLGRPEGQGRTLAVGALAGAVGVGLHSLFEFNFQIPGVTVSLAVMVGLVLGAGETKPAPTAGRWTLVRVGLGALVLVWVLGLLLPGQWSASLDRSRAKGHLERGDAEMALVLAREAGDDLIGGQAAFLLAQREKPEPGAVERARRKLTAATWDDPLRAEPWFQLGLLAMFEKRYEDAFQAFVKARRFTRGMAKPNYTMGAWLMHIGRNVRMPDLVAEGADAVREAGTIDPEYHGKAFDDIGPFVKDVETLRRMTPDTVYGRARLVGLLSKLGRKSEAADELAVLEEMDPTANHAIQLGEMLIRAGRHDEAAGPFRRYLERKGITDKTIDDVEKRYRLGRRPDPALVFFVSLTDGEAHRSARAHYHRARLESHLKRHDDARKSIRQAVRLAPKDERYVEAQKVILRKASED